MKLDQGTTNYFLRRLLRERPDLVARVESGEFSVNAAAIEAGFRNKPTPIADLRRAWKRASEEERKTFCTENNLIEDSINADTAEAEWLDRHAHTTS